MGGLPADSFASSVPRTAVHPTGTPTPPPEAMSEPYHGYSFPHDRLKRRLTRANKTPLVLVSCGSFSPPTSLHMSMFSVAESYVDHTGYELVGSYMSPCSDTYGKSSLVPAHHRINMCRLAIEQTNSNAMIDDWETLRRDEDGHPVYTRTADVLKRLDEQLNDVLGGIQAVDGTFVRARVMLLIGADLALTMSDPKVWAPADIDVLLGYYGAFIVERPALCDIQEAIQPLKKYNDNIMVVPSFQNDVSSTKARAQIRNGEVAQDLPRSVYDYIKLHHLYQSAPAKERRSIDKAGKSELDMVAPRLPVASHR
ncbi:hypothetical protein TGAMA5MH_07522 [Trichoderma gamsii]|uniref:Nicotinamide-nucleotide adenylyltransferase n=1 Tax=Trichoderma gamsii TaxID=398673 RepID=A0A2K0T4S0_9HYPO|nr:hypothetical protein TGAMA5MH_07522 [Trichoderma gamsii]